jgi:hypothetical protein
MSAAASPDDPADRLSRAAERLRRETADAPEADAPEAAAGDDLLAGLDAAQDRVREARRRLAELEAVLGFDYRIKRA